MDTRTESEGRGFKSRSHQGFFSAKSPLNTALFTFSLCFMQMMWEIIMIWQSVCTFCGRLYTGVNKYFFLIRFKINLRNCRCHRRRRRLCRRLCHRRRCRRRHHGAKIDSFRMWKWKTKKCGLMFVSRRTSSPRERRRNISNGLNSASGLEKCRKKSFGSGTESVTAEIHRSWQKN